MPQAPHGGCGGVSPPQEKFWMFEVQKTRFLTPFLTNSTKSSDLRQPARSQRGDLPHLLRGFSTCFSHSIHNITVVWARTTAHFSARTLRTSCFAPLARAIGTLLIGSTLQRKSLFIE